MKKRKTLPKERFVSGLGTAAWVKEKQWELEKIHIYMGIEKHWLWPVGNAHRYSGFLFYFPTVRVA